MLKNETNKLKKKKDDENGVFLLELKNHSIGVTLTTQDIFT